MTELEKLNEKLKRWKHLKAYLQRYLADDMPCSWIKDCDGRIECLTRDRDLARYKLEEIPKIIKGMTDEERAMFECPCHKERFDYEVPKTLLGRNGRRKPSDKPPLCIGPVWRERSMTISTDSHLNREGRECERGGNDQVAVYRCKKCGAIHIEWHGCCSGESDIKYLTSDLKIAEVDYIS
jgi:hypothetical protein